MHWVCSSCAPTTIDEPFVMAGMRAGEVARAAAAEAKDALVAADALKNTRAADPFAAWASEAATKAALARSDAVLDPPCPAKGCGMRICNAYS